MNYHERSYHTMCKAISFFADKFANIALPVLSTYGYDLVAEENTGAFIKVKVIHTISKAPSGTYVVNLRKNTYDKDPEGNNAKYADVSDLFFIESPDGFYLIPTESIENARAISLSMYEKYKIIPS